mmetsp:Transcript_33517/g.79290  ORF Transcript_33517/g.79290 Transcript_33517/m.79290 type:complete len:348 (+) Transcript_33517:116-1159(+)
MSYRKIVCEKLGTNFREVTRIVSSKLSLAPATGHVLVRNEYLGINASDINFTNGTYLPGVQPPFDTGFEAVGKVVGVGEGVSHLKVGQPVCYSAFGAFAEYKEVDARGTIPVAKSTPEPLTLLVSGLTASIALEKVGELTGKETVLVTAAAGATGSFAVQLAKLKGCHVIGTCSSDDKCEALRKLGVDRPINYKKEPLFKTLRAEYPKGVDVVYESVGGEIFDAALNNMAVRGKLIVIGFTSGYQDGSGWGTQTGVASGKKAPTPLPAKILAKSLSLRGFFLNDYAREWKPHMGTLMQLIGEGKLQALTDSTPFTGLEGVADAIEYMYSGKNTGKIIVRLPVGDSKL